MAKPLAAIPLRRRLRGKQQHPGRTKSVESVDVSVAADDQAARHMEELDATKSVDVPSAVEEHLGQPDGRGGPAARARDRGLEATMTRERWAMRAADAETCASSIQHKLQVKLDRWKAWEKHQRDISRLDRDRACAAFQAKFGKLE